MKHQSLVQVAVALLCGSAAVAQAQNSGHSHGPRPVTPISLSVTSQPIAAALNDFARQSGLHVVIGSEVAAGVQSTLVDGTFTPEAALQELLRETGLRYEYLDSETVAVFGSDESRAEVRGDGKIWRLAQLNAALSDGATGGGVVQASDGESNLEEGSTKNSMLEEVIVTATKRNERLQDVPFGISAFTTESLERTGSSGYDEVLAQAPGVQYMGSTRGRNVIVMRGVSTNAGSYDNQQAPVEQFIDDLPLTDRFGPWGGTDLPSYDLARVEVLRGPQGTLFGSGAMGGAVRLITNRPDPADQYARVELGAASTSGGENSTNAAAVVNLPLVDNALALRAVAYKRNDGGWVDNVFRDEKDVNSATQTGGRLMLDYRPAGRFGLGFTALIDDFEADDSPLTFANSSDGASDEWQGILPEVTDSTLNMFSLTLDYDFGWAALTSATTFGKRDMDLVTDWIRLFVDQPAPPETDGTFGITRDSERFAQELRLSSEGESHLKWTLGAFFMDYSLASHQIWDIGPGFRLWLDDKLSVDVQEVALFGEATYEITPKISVTAGARAFRNTYGSLQNSAPAADIQQSAPFLETEDEAVTPKVSVSYRPTDDVHLYLTAAKGYRVGQINFNFGIDPRIPADYKADSLWNYEAGVKSTWFDGLLTANIGIYHIDWRDIQLRRAFADVDFSGHFTNAGTAEIDGVEAEFSLRPNDTFEFGTALSYTDTELTSVAEGVSFTPGSPLPGTPHFSAYSFVQLAHEFSTDRTGYLRVAHRYVGKTPTDLGNPSSFPVDPYHNIDLRAGFRFGPYEVVGYVENVANDHSATTGSGFTADFAPSVNRLKPRTIGMTLRASF